MESIEFLLYDLGWALVSRRFFLYSIYGMAVASLFMELVNFQIPVSDPFLAVLAGGTIIGTGAGITLHSLGSLGGNDIIAILLNQKYNVRMGTYFFIFNLVLFAFSFVILSVDTVLYSLAMSYVTAVVLDHVLIIFNQLKMALIISDHSKAIAKIIHKRLRRGATYLHGSGTYTGKKKKIILSAVHNYQLKRLEEVVFSRDPQAFLITENTFQCVRKRFFAAESVIKQFQNTTLIPLSFTNLYNRCASGRFMKDFVIFVCTLERKVLRSNLNKSKIY